MIAAEEWCKNKLTFHDLNVVKQIQLDAISSAAQVCIDYANEMRESHIHSGDSASAIRKRILELTSNSQ